MTSDADESSTVSQDELKSKSDSDFVGSDRDGSNNGEDSSPPNDDKADSSPMKLHKLIALLTLFVTAFGVGILTHTILENQETNLFEDRVSDSGKWIVNPPNCVVSLTQWYSCRQRPTPRK